jgi:hypothetical protein
MKVEDRRRNGTRANYLVSRAHTHTHTTAASQTHAMMHTSP